MSKDGALTANLEDRYMETRYSRDPHNFERMNTSEIREEFLIEDLFVPDAIKLIYLHIDRMIVGSAVQPANLCSRGRSRIKG